jgi:class 3 adenylate cyclase/tetratricopeptide (TPR) repeat protein
MPESRTVTFLVTDLVNSTEHLQRAGDERAQLLFRAHHKLLNGAVTAAGGEELQWLGDGIVAAFESVADAVRCAISIQQTARRPAAGARFEIRVGINAGEAVREESGYFGTAVVLAKRLCERAEAGQILCSQLIGDLLAARQTFAFRALGPLELKDVAAPVSACEVIYEKNDPATMLQRTPFVGRADQLSKLSGKLEAACNGQGSIVMLVGEPGMGKTRILEEFADHARQRGARVLRGACYDGEWQPPYGPFAEFIGNYAREAENADLKEVIGNGAPTLARIAPALHRKLSDIPEPAALDKDEERLRLLDSVSQFLIALSRRAPLVLVLDDLHWADRGTVGMLNHVAHFTGANPILLIAVYRDAEVGPTHPLSAAVAAMRRLAATERLQLTGLDPEEVAALLGMIADEDAPGALVNAIGAETGGNPFFIREVLLHLMEEGKIFRDGRQWVKSLNVQELKIPEGVREVVNRRIGRLSDDVRRLLTVGAAFNGAFSFDIAASVAELDEDSALTAVDEALAAQLLRSGANADNFDFTHALIRHTLYADLNSVRRVRLHRRIAEAMEKTWGERIREHAAEIAYHFWRGASASGGDRGVDYAIAAADQAEAAYAHDEAIGFIRFALDMLAPGDSRRCALLSRMTLALAWTLDGESACKTAREASGLIVAAQGAVQATVFLEQVARALYAAGLARDSWVVAKEGLRLAGDRRDVIWASLREVDLFREEAEDPDNPGIRVDSAGQREWRALLRSLPPEQVKAHGFDPRYESRLEILGEADPNPATLMLLAGDYKRALRLWQKEAGDSESQGRIGRAITAWGNTASCYTALGELAAARTSMERGAALTARASSAVSGRMLNLNLLSAQHDMRLATDEGWEALLENAGSLDVLNKPTQENNWAFAMIRACGAYFFARINQADVALEWIRTLTEAFDRGAYWEPTYSAMVCDAAAALWLLNRGETAEVVERNIREKVIAPDFRYPMRDGRLSLARLCAVQNRYDEAADWFARARGVLDEQGARPLRALADYDEALMYIRRGSGGDLDRAKPLLQSARDRFNAIGMNGWVLRADAAIAQASPA